MSQLVKTLPQWQFRPNGSFAPMAVSPQWQLPQFDCPNGSETAYTCGMQTAYTCGTQTALSVKLAYIYIYIQGDQKKSW